MKKPKPKKFKPKPIEIVVVKAKPKNQEIKLNIDRAERPDQEYKIAAIEEETT